jgi:hypothetical protein
MSLARGTFVSVAMLVAAALACSEAAEPAALQEHDHGGLAGAPSFAGAQVTPAGATRFEARLAEINGSSAHGWARVEIVGGNLVVSTHGSGMARDSVTPQHIHSNPTCAVPGGPLINLDRGLTVTGESPSNGPTFPSTNAGGVLNYQVSRSLADLRTAVNTFFGQALTSDAELIAWLDLGNRNIHMHQPLAPFTPVDCGAVDPK